MRSNPSSLVTRQSEKALTSQVSGDATTSTKSDIILEASLALSEVVAATLVANSLAAALPA
jgi:hypothetical protein